MNNPENQPLSVLIVDDDPADRAMVQRSLKRDLSKVDVRVATTRQDLQKMLDESRYDVVVSDYMIRGFTGLDVIDDVRERGMDTPIVMLTGTGTEQVAIEAMKRGVADYVIKNAKHISVLPATILHVMEKHQLEKDLSRLELELQQSQKMEAVGLVTTGVIHDFRNLLTVILNHLAVMESHPDIPNEVVKSMSAVQSAAKQAADLSHSLLSFSRHRSVEHETVDLCMAAEQIGVLLHRILPSGIHQNIDIPAEPVHVMGNRVQLQQVVLNLAINAMEAMPEGGKFHICLSKTDPRPGESPQATLEIRDTGQGMSGDLLEHIYDPFFTTKGYEKGSGLGLTVTKRVIESHHGVIKFQSKAGAGTTCAITLPCLDNYHEGKAQKSLRASKYVLKKCILIAADDQQFNAVIAGELMSLGFRILQVDKLDDVMGNLAQYANEIEMVLLDHDPPNFDGVYCTKSVRESGYQVPIVLMTEKTEPPKDLNGSEGVQIYTKPFEPQDLGQFVTSQFDT